MVVVVTDACAVVCVGCEYAERVQGCDGDGNAGVGHGGCVVAVSAGELIIQKSHVHTRLGSDHHQLIMPPISKDCSNNFLGRSFIYSMRMEHIE